MTLDPVLQKHIAAAVARHRDIEPAVRAIAAELPPREARPWLAMAAVLARSDAEAATAAAGVDPACWMPLVATPPGDPRLFGRLVAAAGRPAVAADRGWATLAYPLVLAALALLLLIGVAVFILPMYEAIFDDFDIELPAITTWVLAIGGFLRSLWKPLLLAAALVCGGRWLAAWWSRRGPAVAAAFTRLVAMLVEGGVSQTEALHLATRAVGVDAVNLARPRRPLTHAAIAALAYDPPVAAGLLEAVADCHEQRALRSRGLREVFLGPLAIVVVGLIVGSVALGLLLPLLKMIKDLT
jgi:hypothetical protein